MASVLDQFIQDNKPADFSLPIGSVSNSEWIKLRDASESELSKWQVASKALMSNADVLGDDANAIQTMFDEVVGSLEQ